MIGPNLVDAFAAICGIDAPGFKARCSWKQSRLHNRINANIYHVFRPFPGFRRSNITVRLKNFREGSRQWKLDSSAKSEVVIN
jgi:hypothetical protein